MKVRASEPTTSLIFTEKSSLCAQMDDADVHFLLEHHRAHLDVRPAGQTGHYLLSSRGHVGVIAAPTRRIFIRPRPALQNLFLMLDPMSTDAGAADAKLPRRREELLDFLLCQLALRLRKKHDPAKTGFFAPLSTQPNQVAESKPAAITKITTSPLEKASDTQATQLAVSLLEYVLASGLLGTRFRDFLTTALLGFEDVARVSPHEETFALLLRDAAADGQRALLDLTRSIADGLHSIGHAPGHVATSFLLRMSRVFEQYVTRGIRVAFADEMAAVSTQPWYRLRSDSRSTPVIAFCPDVTLDRANRPLINVQLRGADRPGTA